MTNQTRSEKIQTLVDAAIASVPFQWRNRDTKTTKKALAEIEALGLTEYLPENMRTHGGKYASSVAAVIKAATYAGNERQTDGQGDDTFTFYTDAAELYILLNTPEDEPKRIVFGREFTPSQATLDYIASGDHLSTKNHRSEKRNNELIVTRVTTGPNVDSVSS